MITRVWYQPEDEDVMECLIVEGIPGPKAFLRLWPTTVTNDTDPELNWGWVVNDKAKLIYEEK